jgi:putative addiction module component (TIGR02574 family)
MATMVLRILRRYDLAMSTQARKLYDAALELPAADRAELAADLLASLDGVPDADVAAAWHAEIERRAHAAIAAPEDDVSWESVRAELHADPPPA